MKGKREGGGREWRIRPDCGDVVWSQQANPKKQLPLKLID